MKVSGFTIARNVVRADYPIKEAIYSILPLCDEVIVAVGNSEDGTLDFIKSFNEPKIKILETVWDDSLREGGKVLAVETNKALSACAADSDWCIYIQADECLHEDDYKALKEAMQEHKDNKNVEGLLLKYRHFYGSYDYIADSRQWYRNEIRIVRNAKGVQSYKDAQGFRLEDRKLKVKKVDAHVHHYGWVKHPDSVVEKSKQATRYWHSDEYIEENKEKILNFKFEDHIDSLAKFKGTHPALMQERIVRKNWEFEYDISKKNYTVKKRILHWIEKLTGWRIGEYKNYKLI